MELNVLQTSSVIIRNRFKKKKRSQALSVFLKNCDRRNLKVPLKMKRIVTGREKFLRRFCVKQGDEVY